eukprot:6470751-Amphidinium_carterae.1
MSVKAIVANGGRVVFDKESYVECKDGRRLALVEDSGGWLMPLTLNAPDMANNRAQAIAEVQAASAAQQHFPRRLGLNP